MDSEGLKSRFVALAVLTLAIVIVALIVWWFAPHAEPLPVVSREPYSPPAALAPQAFEPIDAPDYRETDPEPEILIESMEWKEEPYAPPPFLHGIVVDERERALPTARLYTDAAPEGVLANPAVLNNLNYVRCDEQGRFVLDLSRYDLDEVLFHAPGHQIEIFTIPDPMPSEPVTVILVSQGIIEGGVWLRERPIDANVQVQLASIPLHEGMKSAGRTGYKFEALPRGDTLVTALLDDSFDVRGRTIQRLALVAPGLTTRVDFHFADGPHSVEGYVTVPAPGAVSATVELHVDTRSTREKFSTRVTPEGYFLFEGIPAGQGVLRTSATWGGRGEQRTHRKIQPVAVRGEEPVRRDVAFEGEGSLRVILQAEEDPGYSFDVLILDPPRTPRRHSEILLERQAPYLIEQRSARANREFTIEHIAPGRYTAVTHTDEGRLITEVITVRDGESPRVRLRIR